MLNSEQIHRIFPNGRKFWIGYLEDNIEEIQQIAHLTTKLRMAHFLAQVAVETGGLRSFVENLNYKSASRILKIYSKHFNSIQEARPYVGQPQKLANKVYANRLGNGSVSSGDGWKYRGKGPIQITFRDNHRDVGKAMDVNFLVKPDLILEPEYGWKSSCAYWTVMRPRQNAHADRDDLESVRRGVNGGTHGLELCRQWLDGDPGRGFPGIRKVLGI